MTYSELMGLFTFDRVVAVLGFAFALWQLCRTRTAAESARKSAGDAITALHRLAAATKMHDIASRSRDLLRLLRSKALAPAASAAFELRDSVARYRHDSESQKLISDEDWQKALVDVRMVHERLESLTLTTKASAEDREALVHEVSRLHTTFAELAAKAGSEGVSNGHS